MNVAKGLRIDHKRGSIEKGKDADLLLISHDCQLDLVRKVLASFSKMWYNNKKPYLKIAITKKKGGRHVGTT